MTQDSGLRTQDELCSDIDFVIPWVDGSDPEWQAQKNFYSTKENKVPVMNGAERYRDWGILQYWFRAVEKYAPWVRKIHFITCGQVPEWLNLNHPKLHFVRHEDYIPHEWLPTFSANPIELNLHRITGLSEKFVYFNDDIFLNAPVKPEDFFVNGLPCSCAALNPGPYGMNNTRVQEFSHIPLNGILIIKKYFDFGKSFKSNLWKWLTLRYGAKILLKTLLLLPFWRYSGFHETHTANAYLKSTFIDVGSEKKKHSRKQVAIGSGIYQILISTL